MDSQATQFAPADRADLGDLSRQSQLLQNSTLLRQMFNAVNEIVLILNEQRQIVFYNRPFAELLRIDDAAALLGMRPGEAMDCMHACQSPAGCGTSEFCSTCGAVRAILTSQAGTADVRECRITRGESGEAIDLLVKTTPLMLSGEKFTIFAVTDISHQNRRRALERIFFHDVMNTLVGLEMLSKTLMKAAEGKVVELATGVRRAVFLLTDEIAAQRDLAAAENRELAVRPIRISSREFLADIMDNYRHLQTQNQCQLTLADDSYNVTIETDYQILTRVVGNMLKNAIEASGLGQIVTLGCRPADGKVSFWVHNHGFIPREVQLQLFQRSFSTKGTGRGLGTYSMKLLTEKYLKGQVGFASSPEKGTTFTAVCPTHI